MVNNVQLFKGDCLEVMGKLIERGVKVDMVLTDPPYGINLMPQRKGSKYKGEKILNDNSLEWLPKFSEQIYQLTKNVAVVFCSWQQIDVFKSELQKKFTIKNILVWNKKWIGLGGNYRPNYELIILACKKNIKTKSKNKSNILEYRKLSPSKTRHSCEKPIDLLEDLLVELTNEGDLILDCFMGSGSTGVACMNTNRKFIGIELDDNYFEIAKKRIEEHGNG